MIGLCHACHTSGIIITLSKKDKMPRCGDCFEKELNSIV